MFHLTLKSEPYWIDLPRGVQVQVLPARSSMMDEVRHELFADVTTEDAGEEDAKAAALSVGMLGWAKAIARHAIVAWQGVGDETGAPIEPSPDYIDALIEDDKIYQAWRDKYVLPALAVDEEGNG
ncbi:hypothetical protein [Mameliella sp.]|uniref:hypothetical protein n=1 Tax=Mameliella sp. TaxID=1924940 RepID=UPI003BAA6A9B